jgi:SAM-dependent methyltransferase
VSFETIEHVEDADSVLREFRRVLSRDGVLVVSTPNKSEYLVDNEFHTREFTSEEFAALLRGHFEPVEIRYQQNWLATAVLAEASFTAEETRLDLDAFKAEALEPGRELYTIALCGRAERPHLRDVVVTTGVFEANQLATRAVEAERVQAEWEARATEAERQVAHCRRELEEARATLERIERSASWRLTRPLRSLKASVRGRG